ncbi:MAG: hypothetical protein FWC41_05135 [Firmicutes bacterium]|nr:hypothetical protein [Bacillota bacterium]
MKKKIYKHTRKRMIKLSEEKSWDLFDEYNKIYEIGYFANKKFNEYRIKYEKEFKKKGYNEYKDIEKEVIMWFIKDNRTRREKHDIYMTILKYLGEFDKKGVKNEKKNR